MLNNLDGFYVETLVYGIDVYKGLLWAIYIATLSDACVHKGPLVYGPEYLRKKRRVKVASI